MKEKLNVLGMDIESLGQQFKQNLIFLFNVIKSKETMAKEWQNSSQEILSLKLQVKVIIFRTICVFYKSGVGRMMGCLLPSIFINKLLNSSRLC